MHDQPHGGPADLRSELGRLAVLWRDLPLEAALAEAPRLRALAASVAVSMGAAAEDIRDLGPATALDQLHVLCNEFLGSTRCPSDEAELAGRVRIVREAVESARTRRAGFRFA